MGNRFGKRLAMGCAAVVLAALAASSSAAEPPARAVRRAKSLFAARADALRKASAKDASMFARYLSLSYQADGEAVRKAWSDISAAFPPERLGDFLAGAEVICGPASRRQDRNEWAGVVALYNPEWDAIMVMRLDDDLRIGRLALLDGEAFRGESAGDDAAADLREATAARFGELYPDGADATTARIPPRGVPRGLSAVKARSELRAGQRDEPPAAAGSGDKFNPSKEN